MTIAESVSDFIHDLTYEEIPEEVIAKIKTCLLHGTGIGLAGYSLVGGEISRKVVSDPDTPFCRSGGEATVLGCGIRTSVEDAAFANSAMFHGRIQEDTHGTMHIGTVCTPVALALSEAYGKTGKEFLTALVAAYETEAAIGKFATAESTARGFRASAIYGVFGACAAACRLMGLSKEQMVNAFGFACAFNGGLIGTPDTQEWRFEVGIVPRIALMACMLAKHGGIGNPACFEKKKGFFDCFARLPEKASEVTGELGRTWETLNVTFKLYPVCAFNQTHVINMMELLKGNPFDAGDVVSVHINANKYEADYPGSVFYGPFQNHGQTAVSCPFSVAACIVSKGRCSYADVTRYEDPEIKRLVSVTEVTGKEELAPLCSEITVTLKNGEKLSRNMYVEESYYSLDFDTEAAQLLKIRDEIPVSQEKLSELFEEIRHIDEKPDVRRLIELTLVGSKESGSI